MCQEAALRAGDLPGLPACHVAALGLVRADGDIHALVIKVVVISVRHAGWQPPASVVPQRGAHRQGGTSAGRWYGVVHTGGRWQRCQRQEQQQ